MENNQENKQASRYLKRTQKDYTMSFKLQIVQEIEHGLTTISVFQKDYAIQSRYTIIQWLSKFGAFDWENQTPSHMPKSPEQKITELEAKVKLLEKQKTFLEQQAFVAD
jgi:transposase-like protein